MTDAEVPTSRAMGVASATVECQLIEENQR
jgi:hypothetical protein